MKTRIPDRRRPVNRRGRVGGARRPLGTRRPDPLSWQGRVRRLAGGDYDVTLADGHVVRVSKDSARKAVGHFRLPTKAAVWAWAVRGTYTTDDKALNYHSLFVEGQRFKATVCRFLADHSPPCQCRVCEMLATIDLTDDGLGGRVMLLANQLYILLMEGEWVFGNFNHDPEDLR